jgi:SAM-dependent methyltransferase
MPFRWSFDCLWCGAHHETRTADDVEGWAGLCPTCIGRAGENGFLRFRLRTALEERGRARGTVKGLEPEPREHEREDHEREAREREDRELIDYYEARAPEYDDWYLRRGTYDRGPIATVAWQADLDAATRWLDAQPWSGRIVELAAGTGWWSPILASRGELWCFDAAAAPLALARERLIAHGLRAHLHVRDAWAEPDAPADGLFAGFWLSHIRPERLPAFLALARRWLRPGGLFAFVDSRPDPESGSTAQHAPDGMGLSTRRLSDGRTFRIPKLFHEPDALATALRATGFADVDVRSTDRFFILGRAVADGAVDDPAPVPPPGPPFPEGG